MKSETWITEGFEGFSKGTLENSGQNLFISKKGVLQRIFQYDVNQDGYPDILFACSQSMYERPPVHVYENPLCSAEPLKLPTNGGYDGLFADLHGSGYDDLVVACQADGTHHDVTAIIYFGSQKGLTEEYKLELPAPNATGVCAGDFNGDGKPEILFASDGKLRMFFQKERGFNPSDFVEIDIPARFVAAGDFDGDGFCDACVKDKDGKVTVLFGGKDGLSVENSVRIETEKAADGLVEGSTTAGMSASATEWRPCAVTLDGKLYLFAASKDSFQLLTCGKDRAFTAARTFPCEGAVGVCASDLTGNGRDDLAVAVFADRDKAADCRVYLADENGISADRYETLPVVGAVSVTAAQIDGSKVIFCRSGERVQLETPSPIVSVGADGKLSIDGYVTGGDCCRIAAGKPSGTCKNDTIAVINHVMNRGQGHEDIFIYLGGEDGYRPDRRLELPGHSSVDGAMIDFFDTGKVDVFVCNCFEDAIFMDDGSYIYLNDGSNHFDPNRKIVIPSVRGHGGAIADFRKSGYLDIAVGGFQNREVRIFHGSEKGYSLDNCTRLVLGPNDGAYAPAKREFGKEPDYTEEEKKLITEFGQVRWLLAADFNGDGWLDLFVSEILGPRCFIFWGGPDGFSTERMTTLQTDGVASATAADLNGNGYLDLILAQHMSTRKPSKYESYITVYWGGPDGYQENRKMQLPASCANSVTVGDYSGKGKLDLYATSYNNGRCRDLLSFLYPNTDGKFSVTDVKYLFNHSGSGCVSGDFNGDGYTDLAVACHKEYGNHCSHSFIFWGGPDGLSDERKTLLPTTGPHGMCTVDPGNIMDRGPKERYTSEIYEAKKGAILRSITWEGECTSTSWVEVECRAANTREALEKTEWQTVENGADLTKLHMMGCVQYRLALCAKCSCGTPRIYKVTVDFE